MTEKILNLSTEPLRLPKDVSGFKRLTVLPDYSPNRHLPTGVIISYPSSKHKINSDFLGSDIGCGMLLARFVSPVSDFQRKTDQIASELLNSKNGFWGLGGGNHFVTFYQVEQSSLPTLHKDAHAVLIHSGSRNKGIEFYEKRMDSNAYLLGQQSILDHARDNRRKISNLVERTFSTKLTVLINTTHNFIEMTNREIIYRKGAVKAKPGDIAIISSSMTGNAAVVMANNNVAELQYSLPHGTGRRISRSESKLESFSQEPIDNIYIPRPINQKMLNGEHPRNYRTLEEVLEKILPYVGVISILSPKSTIMS